MTGEIGCTRIPIDITPYKLQAFRELPYDEFEELPVRVVGPPSHGICGVDAEPGDIIDVQWTEADGTQRTVVAGFVVPLDGKDFTRLCWRADPGRVPDWSEPWAEYITPELRVLWPNLAGEVRGALYEQAVTLYHYERIRA